MKAFISYSHRDEDSLNRLHTHLAMLRREGAISDWFDRRILAGTSIDAEISKQLANSRLFLALVSPDFLASDYCYDKEMQSALKMHEAGSIVLVPIILHPCDWLVSPLGQLKALPRDGHPISQWTNESAAYLDVVTELRKLINSFSDIEGERQETSPQPKPPPVQSAKYRAKRTFDEIDREEFKASAFGIIREYFEKSIGELNGIDGLRGRYQLLAPLAFTCTVINQNIKPHGSSTAHITIRADGNSFLGDIYWSNSANARDNVANGSIRIEHDEYRQFLTMDTFSSSRRERTWTADEAKQKLWEDFIKQAGISYD